MIDVDNGKAESGSPALDELLVKALPRLASFARRLTQESAEAEDLVQETCRRAIEARAQFTVGTNALGWLSCILRNVFFDKRRRLCRETSLGNFEIESPAPEAMALWRQVSDEDIWGALSSLADCYQTTFRRHALEGQPYEQVARELSVSTSTVGVRINRARTKARAFLKKQLRQRGCLFVDG